MNFDGKRIDPYVWHFLIKYKGACRIPLLPFLVTLLFARMPMVINALSCERNLNAVGGFGLAH